MNKRNQFSRGMLQAVAMAGMVWLLAGCVSTPKIDWNSRVGVYTYDQAMIDYGPPDKSVKLSDSSTVAEWMTRRGYYHHSFAGFGGFYGPFYYPYPHYGPYFAPSVGYYDPIYYPDRFLRLVFSPDGKLKDWRALSK